MVNENFEIVANNDVEVFYTKRKKVLDNKITKRIDQIWNNLLTKRELFNGSLLNFVEIKKDQNKTFIYGEFVDYKTFMAHKENPDLGLNINPVSVSGITVIREGNKRYVVFAKRKNTTQYCGYFESVPSGDLEKEIESPSRQIDYKQQLIKEFEQEINLPKEAILSIDTLGVIFDKKEKNYDICCMINTKSTKKQLKNAIKNSKEYNSIKFVEESKLEEFIEENSSSLVPTSIGITRFCITKLYISKIQKIK